MLGAPGSPIVVATLLTSLAWYLVGCNKARRGAHKNDSPALPAALPKHLTDAAAQPLKRQVFISHTGQDKDAMDFAVSTLRPALEAAGLPVYMDYSDLRAGTHWREELIDAAANSAIVVVVLSKSFGTRYWCMLELDLALHAHSTAPDLQAPHAATHGSHSSPTDVPPLAANPPATTTNRSITADSGSSHRPQIIPVFYDDPDLVIKSARLWARHAAVERYLRRNEMLDEPWLERVDAARWARNLRAMKQQVQHVRRTLSTSKARNIQIATYVVELASKALPLQLDVGSGLVGVERQQEELAAVLSCQLALWLYGCGGGGKTTMAKLLFNRLSGGFAHRAFVELQTGDGPDRAGHHLGAALTSLGANPGSGKTAAELSKQLKDWVRGRRVLYVLDNVWTASQLDVLLPTEWGEGSAVLVTSRSQTISESRAVGQDGLQFCHRELDQLEPAAARQLFRRAAGIDAGSLPEQLQTIEKSIVASCGGLPLALQLMGGQLRSKLDPKLWQAALAALQQGLATGQSEDLLSGVLFHSLAGLKFRHVSMFLDVATMLWGEPASRALAVWEAWHGASAAACFEDLRRRCLLGVGGGGGLVMHDVLKALGRGLVLERQERLEQQYGTRLWVQDGRVEGWKQAMEGAGILAADLRGTGGAAALFSGLTSQKWSATRILWTGEMAGLDALPVGMEELLWLQTALVEHPLEFPPHSTLGHPSLQAAALPTQLRVLDLSTSQADLASPLQSLPHLTALQTLDLRRCLQLVTLPESFGQLVGLKSLELTGCEQLVVLPEALGQLVGLQVLNLGRCKQLKALPESLGEMWDLHTLDLTECAGLTALPESLGQLADLQALRMSGCIGLGTLPESFGQLAGLQALHLSRCRKLAALPESFGQLVSLQTLDMSDCLQLAALPQSFGQLAGLQKLALRKWRRLAGLPESFSQLAELRELDLSGCGQLGALPESVGRLLRLRMLDLSWCEQLWGLPDSFRLLGELQTLHMRGCEQLRALPDSFGWLPCLRMLDLRDCLQLVVLPESFGELPCLQELDLSGCKELEALPGSFGGLTELRTLILTGCEQLAALPESFGGLQALRALDLTSCKRLEALPDSFGLLTRLRMLDMRWCVRLRGLPGSCSQLLGLQRLDLSGCARLLSLPDGFGRLVRLQILDLNECQELVALPLTFQDLEGLRVLDLGRWTQLVALPESFGRLVGLQAVDMVGCKQLTALPESIGQLTGLQTLDLSWCEQLGALPESFGWLVRLWALDLSSCKQLAALPESIGQLAALRRLDLRGCERLAALPQSFGRLGALRTLNLSRCLQLRGLPECVGQLVGLQKLDLGGCLQLVGLPECFGQLVGLQKLSLSRCRGLAALPQSFGRLAGLHTLDVSHCKQLVVLPESFGRLAGLRTLDLRGCVQLEVLPGSFGRLVGLQSLDLTDCSRLAGLPQSFGLLRALRQLQLSGCSTLAELPPSFGELAGLVQLSVPAHLLGRPPITAAQAQLAMSCPLDD